jgi:hypothetical protein
MNNELIFYPFKATDKMFAGKSIEEKNSKDKTKKNKNKCR